MRILLRLVAVLALVSVVLTVWFVIAFATIGGLHALSGKTVFATFTFIGWAITLGAGPFAAIQLWRLRDSGRRAGIVMFGFGLAYYLGGLLVAPPEAQLGPIWMAALTYAVPFGVLLSKPARETCRGSAGPPVITGNVAAADVGNTLQRKADLAMHRYEERPEIADPDRPKSASQSDAPF